MKAILDPYPYQSVANCDLYHVRDWSRGFDGAKSRSLWSLNDEESAALCHQLQPANGVKFHASFCDTTGQSLLMVHFLM